MFRIVPIMDAAAISQPISCIILRPHGLDEHGLKTTMPA